MLLSHFDYSLLLHSDSYITDNILSTRYNNDNYEGGNNGNGDANNNDDKNDNDNDYDNGNVSWTI